jgi:hypothetical protein
VNETVIRDTTNWEHVIDRAVDRAGHGEHGGWTITPASRIVCTCGDPLYDLQAVA